MKILGVRFGHDASAALIIDGKIIADVAEERFSRVKNDSSFPIKAIEYCLEAGGIDSEELDCLALPNVNIPEAFFSFFSIPDSVISSREQAKPSLKSKIKSALITTPVYNNTLRPVLPVYQKPFRLSERCRIHLCQHHLAHAASAYYTSGLNDEKVLITTLDGRGDGVSVGIWRGQNNRIEPVKLFDGSASIGWFYANVTEGIGWRHGSDEGHTMGLAPYGAPCEGSLDGFYPVFENGYLAKPHGFGEFGRWNDHGANHYHGRDAVELQKKVKELGAENYAAEAQRVLETEVFKLIIPWMDRENTRHLCCAGGIFLNVKMNQKLWYSDRMETQWIYPNPGDSGLAVGAALHAFYSENPGQQHERLDNLYFGPEYTNDEIKNILESRGLVYRYVDNPSLAAARYLADNKIIGWFNGRMESGPRALGNRSILMSPLKAENKDVINARVKFRQPFRPFCPSVLYDKSNDYLVNARDEFFMVTSFVAQPNKKGVIPAVVHVDDTVRPQMVKEEINPQYYNLIKAFGDITGEYIVLNTSFNVKGEPIVCHPREAIRCFFDNGLDILFLSNYLIEKPDFNRK